MLSVPLPSNLVPARFVRRENRFLLQVCLEDSGELVAAHMADPGRLRELLIPGRKIWLHPVVRASRKTQWTAVLVEGPSERSWVSLDTTMPNRLIKRGLEAGGLEELKGWRIERVEASIGSSRLDFLLARDGGGRMALEVKSVTLVRDGVGFFPDAVTSRGARHMRELAQVASRPGWEAAVLFVLQRNDADRICAAQDIDPRFAETLRDALGAGVRILGRRCRVGLDSVSLGPPVLAEVG